MTRKQGHGDQLGWEQCQERIQEVRLQLNLHKQAGGGQVHQGWGGKRRQGEGSTCAKVRRREQQ